MNTPHYYVQLAEPVSSQDWFEIVLRFKHHMQRQGFEIDEFGDTHESDRDAVRAAGSTTEFEGQGVFPTSDMWQEAMLEFFRIEGLPVAESEFEHYPDTNE